jgi:hypothetical protein
MAEKSNLSELEEELDKNLFYRANRKYIINANYIKRFKPLEKSKISVELVPARQRRDHHQPGELRLLQKMDRRKLIPTPVKIKNANKTPSPSPPPTAPVCFLYAITGFACTGSTQSRSHSSWY